MTTVDLQHNEQIILDCATRLFCSYLQAGKIAEGQEKTTAKNCVKFAIGLAREVDLRVKEPRK